MGYIISLSTDSGSDWSEAVELFNNDTNKPLSEIDDGLIEIVVRDRGNCTILSGSTDDGIITRPATGVFQWTFPKDRLSCLCAGTTYSLGCRFTDETGTVSLFTGSLAYLDGEF